MRKRIFNFAVLAAAAGILAACSSFEEIPAVPELSKAEAQAVDSITVTFTATFEQPEDTRTSLDPVSKKQVKWSTGDKVTVIGSGSYPDGNGAKPQKLTKYFSTTGTVKNISQDGFSAEIETSLQLNIVDSKGHNREITYSEYYAVYPAITTNSPSDNLSISASLKSEQTATAGTFADGVNISAAKSDDKNEFHFQNLCALLSFTVDTDIVSATLTSKSQTPMSGGTATISFSDDTPSISMPVTGSTSSSVKLIGNIEQGTQYYFVVYPGEHESGFTLEFETSSGKKATMSSSTGISLLPKSNIFLGNIEIPAEKWMPTEVGVYSLDYDCEYGYQKYYDQLVWSVLSDQTYGFRIQNIGARKFFDISGLPEEYTKGDTFPVDITENIQAKDGSTKEYSDTVEVINIGNGIVRLLGSEHLYIIKTK